MRAGRTAEADAIAAHIRTIVTRSSSRWLRKADTRKSAKDTWAKVREVIKGKANQTGEQVDGLTAQIFNDHYAAIYRLRLLRTQAETDGTQRSALHYRDVCVSDAGHTATNSDWYRPDTGVVSST